MLTRYIVNLLFREAKTQQNGIPVSNMVGNNHTGSVIFANIVSVLKLATEVSVQ